MGSKYRRDGYWVIVDDGLPEGDSDRSDTDPLSVFDVETQPERDDDSE